MVEDEADDERALEPEPLEATGPDGRVYRVVAVRRGMPLNTSESMSSSLWDVLLDGMFQLVRTASASRLRGWKVGVVSQRSPIVGGGVKHKELVEDRDAVVARMHEVASLVVIKGPKLS